MSNWKNLQPSEVVEVFGSVIWNGKSRVIVFPKRLLNSLPELRDRRKQVIYKMEIFLSRKKYDLAVSKICEGKQPLPIHLYIKGVDGED